MSNTNGSFWRLGVPALACAKLVLAGGFWVTVGNPAASKDPKAKDAVMIVRPDGCHDAAKAKVQATAEGLVKGRRQSVALTLVPLSAPGTYAVKREWPAEGAWVVSIVATDSDRSTAAIVPIAREGFKREFARFMQGPPAAADIDAALRGM